MDTIGYVNVSLQCFGILISLIIILFLSCFKKKLSRLDWLYVQFLICNTVLQCVNVISWVFDGHSGMINRTIVIISNFCMFLLSYLLIDAFMQYLVCYLEERGANGRTAMQIIRMIVVIGIMLLIISQFNHLYYRIDFSNFYIRGEFYWLSNVIGMLGIVPAFWLVLHYRNLLNPKEFIIFLTYLILPLGAVITLVFAYGAIFIHVVTTFVAVCIYIFIQAEQGQKMSEKELELEKNRTANMLSQIQPHFLYNALNSIQFLCRTNPEVAADVVMNFSNYLRWNMDSLTQENCVSVKQELQHLENYLCIERLRFPYIKFCYNLQTQDFKLPALTIQPLVENAIRYGVTQKDEDTGTVTISTWENESGFFLRIEDDGEGFDPMQTQYDGRSHIGISNTRARLKTMCNGELTVQSTQGQGTCVTVMIPKEEN